MVHAQPVDQEPEAVRLRVLSYNVHGQRDDTAALAAAVRSVEPDVVIVQEAPRRFRWRQRCAALADRLALVVAGGGLPSLGNLLLTNLRVQVLRTWCRQFPLTPGRHMRGAAFAECAIGSARFVVAGSHLSTDATERPGQATLLKADLAAVHLPLILGADLNENSGGAAWRTLADGLTDAAVAADRADRCTYSCANPRDRIDALFVSSQFRVVDYDVVDTEQTRRASDHFPVLVDLLLPVTRA
ncbi:endonuclease/exonuclease/phosphatase family protein [Micromonospora polyrhachis]|uniref:Endonuclease/exonuclease/phosphatase family metal-dependent hydrolase n=1 Tax=Micromonospora polyrhachis TaxID=1282883 RepID=A0A7W7SUC8_9ACTN|nr:endonuclease/exonuclease/phosphatase family protein [Micromonospora polyrhachis]MBB4961147.1 endonuclease/exonuclease/phosphatase family metal-dependent hydrolase [Micromonospora polyrhachis]